jgi:ribosomal-protein-alanine N-acetyltransferase
MALWSKDATTVELRGRRIMLRPLLPSDFAQWREVRLSNVDWLTRWEPRRLAGQPDPVADENVFAARCSARARERQLGTGYGFGLFLGNRFAGEINVSAVQRGPFQSAYIGYWIDHRHAGNGYIPEGLVVLFQYAFETLRLHRLQIAIIPRNHASRRVVAKLGLREEGVAQRYLEINGVWEDHVRFAITSEEWQQRRAELAPQWIG